MKIQRSTHDSASALSIHSASPSTDEQYPPPLPHPRNRVQGLDVESQAFLSHCLRAYLSRTRPTLRATYECCALEARINNENRFAAGSELLKVVGFYAFRNSVKRIDPSIVLFARYDRDDAQRIYNSDGALSASRHTKHCLRRSPASSVGTNITKNSI